MTHPDPAEEHLAAIQLRYEEAKASIIGSGDEDPLPETEAIDVRALPPVPRGRGDDARPVTVFRDNVVAHLPGRRPWWRRAGRHSGGAGRR